MKICKNRWISPFMVSPVKRALNRHKRFQSQTIVTCRKISFGPAHVQKCVMDFCIKFEGYCLWIFSKEFLGTSPPVKHEKNPATKAVKRSGGSKNIGQTSALPKADTTSVLATGKYGCTEVRVYPEECGEQLGRDPSKFGNSKSLVLKSFWVERTLWDSSLLVSLTLWDAPVLFTPPLPLPQLLTVYDVTFMRTFVIFTVKHFPSKIGTHPETPRKRSHSKV